MYFYFSPPLKPQVSNPLTSNHVRSLTLIRYARQPAKGHWEYGYKRGNHEHNIERHEHGAHHSFKSKVRWHDQHGGHGEHYFDYNHKGTGEEHHKPKHHKHSYGGHYAASSDHSSTIVPILDILVDDNPRESNGDKTRLIEQQLKPILDQQQQIEDEESKPIPEPRKFERRHKKTNRRKKKNNLKSFKNSHQSPQKSYLTPSWPQIQDTTGFASHHHYYSSPFRGPFYTAFTTPHDDEPSLGYDLPR